MRAESQLYIPAYTAPPEILLEGYGTKFSSGKANSRGMSKGNVMKKRDRRFFRLDRRSLSYWATTEDARAGRPPLGEVALHFEAGVSMVELQGGSADPTGLLVKVFHLSLIRLLFAQQCFL